MRPTSSFTWDARSRYSATSVLDGTPTFSITGRINRSSRSSRRGNHWQQSSSAIAVGSSIVQEAWSGEVRGGGVIAMPFNACHGVPCRAKCTVSCHTIPYHIRYHTILYQHTTPHFTASHYTTPSYTTPHHTTPHHTPYHTTPHHTTPHHTTPHHTTPHHTTPHHTTPHHTTQPHHTTLCHATRQAKPG